MSQLQSLDRMVKAHEKEMVEALCKDLGRPPMEASGLDLIVVQMEITNAISQLKNWMKPTYTNVAALVAPATSEYIYEPYGLTLIIGPFNYPIQLALLPVMAAVISGNVVVLKPSELAPACEKLVAKLIPEYLDRDCVAVVLGDIPVTTQLLAQRWDKIFFTGSPRVGRIVMEAAAKHLTPVSLELGGKSPCYVDESVTDLELAAKRIAWGKMVNAGQTCIAPDYILVHEKIYDNFVKTVTSTVQSFYGSNPKSSPDFARIISEGHCERLKNLIYGANGRLVCGGEVDSKLKYCAPTIIADIDPSTSALMKEELFGPIMPIVRVSNIDQVIDLISQNEKPLALYLFGKNREAFDKITNSVTSGGVCVNDTLMHVIGDLPFGGVGPSGLGAYHGKFSFECFSHRRAILRRDDHTILDVPVRYPPYTDFGLKVFKSASKLPSLPTILPKTMKTFIVTVLISSLVWYLIYNKAR